MDMTVWQFLTARLTPHDLCDLLCRLGENIELEMVDRIVDNYEAESVIAELEAMGYDIDDVSSDGEAKTDRAIGRLDAAFREFSELRKDPTRLPKEKE